MEKKCSYDGSYLENEWPSLNLDGLENKIWDFLSDDI